MQGPGLENQSGIAIQIDDVACRQPCPAALLSLSLSSSASSPSSLSSAATSSSPTSACCCCSSPSPANKPLWPAGPASFYTTHTLTYHHPYAHRATRDDIYDVIIIHAYTAAMHDPGQPSEPMSGRPGTRHLSNITPHHCWHWRKPQWHSVTFILISGRSGEPLTRSHAAPNHVDVRPTSQHRAISPVSLFSAALTAADDDQSYRWNRSWYGTRSVPFHVCRLAPIWRQIVVEAFLLHLIDVNSF